MADEVKVTVPVGVAKKYWAFISYSHADAAFAIRLQKKLEAYRIPRALVGRDMGGDRIPERLRPVFRDRDELASAPDLQQALQERLTASRTLIVVCSPAAVQSPWVNEEVRAFSTLQPAQRILCVIADPIVKGDPPQGTDPARCFPSVLLEPRAKEGFEERVAAPLAADARSSGDGWSAATLKIIAGILNVDFDELNRRERRRRRRQWMLQAALAALTALLVMAAYVYLADARAPLPGATAIQRELDLHNITWSRPVPTASAVQAAARLRSLLISDLGHRWRQKEWFLLEPNLPDAPRRLDVWLGAQVASGILRGDGTAGRDSVNDDILKVFDEAFAPGTAAVVTAGRWYMWRFGQYVPGAKEIMGPDVGMGSSLWLSAAIALASARRHPGEGADRQRLLAYLSKAEMSAEPFDAGDGGWNTFPNQIDREQHSTYAAALALLALLEIRSAGLEWQGSTQARDAELTSTASWLINNFKKAPSGSGWQGAPSGGEPVIDGLSWQVYAALLRSEAEAGVELPNPIVQALGPAIAALAERTAGFQDKSTMYRRLYHGADGKIALGVDSVQYAWHPWAIETCVWWIRRLERRGAPRDAILEARRTLGHLIIDLGDEMTKKIVDGVAFPVAETSYTLASVAAP
jgi:hypothetical protein